MPKELVTVSKLRKSFGRVAVLRDVSFSCGTGTLCLLLGRNGAGKSTLLKSLANLQRPESGSITTEENSHIAYLGHALQLYGSMSVAENLSLQLSLLQCKTELQSLLVEWDLTEIADKHINLLSRGQQARTALCQTFLSNPNLVLLDEPTSSLDDTTVSNLMQMLRKRTDDGATAILATHDLTRLRDYADRILVLERGVVAADSAVTSIEDAICYYAKENR